MGIRKKREIQYQSAPVELRGPILDRGHVEAWELFRIVAWKSAKGLGWLSLNDPEEIERATRVTLTRLAEWDGPRSLLKSGLTDAEWKQWEDFVGTLIGADASHGGPTGLLRLSGVGYPVATAVLSILEPDLFPVLDKWGVKAIFGKVVSARTTKWHNKSAYRQYTQALTSPAAKELGAYRTLRERDVATMTAGKQDRAIVKEWPLPLR